MNMGLFTDIAVGACFGLAAIGSCWGGYVVGMAVIGAWKKCYLYNKPAPFVLVVFASAPITQVIYGYLLMNALNASPLGGFKLLGLGIFSGLALGASAFVQSSVSAAGADAYAETEQGFVNYILIYGLVESMALFIMVFTMLIAGG